MRREVERLLKQATRDLENARKNVAIEAYEVSAFMAQQAVEMPCPTNCTTRRRRGRRSRRPSR